jgi:hypothetical protein
MYVEGVEKYEKVTKKSLPRHISSNFGHAAVLALHQMILFLLIGVHIIKLQIASIRRRGATRNHPPMVFVDCYP